MANQSNKLNKLTQKHINFCEIYIEQGFNNAAGAYRKAFKMNDIESSKRRAYILLKDPLVSNYLKERQEELRKQFNINKEDLIMDLINIKNSNIIDYIDIKNYIDDDGEPQSKVVLKDLESLSISQQRNIKSIKISKNGGVELTLKDSMDAIEKISKLLGLYENNIVFDTRIDTSSLANLSFEQLKELMKE